MKFFNLSDNTDLLNFGLYQKEKQYFIATTQSEFFDIAETLGIVTHPIKKYSNMDENIRFESYANYDFLSFIYFAKIDTNLHYDVFDLYYSKQFIVLVYAEEEGLHNQFIDEFFSEKLHETLGAEKTSFVYYQLLVSAFSKMFDAMCKFENILAGMENDLLLEQKAYPYEEIVKIKNVSFAIEKTMRLLLYVGDQLVANDNKLIPNTDLRYFKNVDMRINRMYEYSKSIHEMCDHLMDLYDTSVNTKNNNLLNKLTVFTFFAVPLTILTGLYGMNFTYMPELEHRYGYFILLGVMAAIVAVIFAVLKRLKLL